MLRKGALLLAVVGTLSACGHTPHERLVSGALIGGLVGATVAVASEPGYHSHRGHHYKRRGHGHHHRHRHHRRHRGWDRY
jgi:hypothetical protein